MEMKGATEDMQVYVYYNSIKAMIVAVNIARRTGQPEYICMWPSQTQLRGIQREPVELDDNDLTTLIRSRHYPVLSFYHGLQNEYAHQRVTYPKHEVAYFMTWRAWNANETNNSGILPLRIAASELELLFFALLRLFHQPPRHSMSTPRLLRVLSHPTFIHLVTDGSMHPTVIPSQMSLSYTSAISPLRAHGRR
jgi:hypothetical protein